MIHLPELISVLINSPTHHHHHHQSGKWRTEVLCSCSVLIFSMLSVSMSGHQIVDAGLSDGGTSSSKSSVTIGGEPSPRCHITNIKRFLSSCPFISLSHIMISAAAVTSLHLWPIDHFYHFPSIDGTFHVQSVECFQAGLCFCDRSNIILIIEVCWWVSQLVCDMFSSAMLS